MSIHHESVTHYSRPARWLHWSIAALLILTFALGVFLDNTSGDGVKFLLIKFHAPFGILVGILTLVRTYYAFKHPRPLPGPSWSPLVKWASKITHILLYVLPLGLVVSGIGTMALSGLSEMLISGRTEVWPGMKDVLPRQGHGITSKLLLAAIVLHIAGAIYHHWVVKDNLISRMTANK